MWADLCSRPDSHVGTDDGVRSYISRLIDLCAITDDGSLVNRHHYVSAPSPSYLGGFAACSGAFTPPHLSMLRRLTSLLRDAQLRRSAATPGSARALRRSATPLPPMLRRLMRSPPSPGLLPLSTFVFIPPSPSSAVIARLLLARTRSA